MRNTPNGQFGRLVPNWTDARASGVPVGWAPLAAGRRSLGAFLDLGPAAPRFNAGHLAQGGALQAPREHNLRSAGQAGKAARAFLKVTPPDLAWGRPPSRK